MRNIRTDLALERHSLLPEEKRGGITVTREEDEGVVLTKISVETEAAARELQKPRGVYYTAELESFPDSQSLLDGRLRALTKALEQLLPPAGPVLAVGLGNANITPDALGPKCAEMVLATRHITEETRKSLSLPALREVCVLAPGVTGQTGLEAAEMVKSVCAHVRPAAVIAVDALAAGSVQRLVKTVQLSSAGVEPGSGVGNARRALNAETLGVPVVSVGVPTVVDAFCLARELAHTPGDLPGEYAGMVVTPREIDTVIESASRLLALAVNCALQKNLSPAELLGLM